jgi:hypothetical protein
MTHGFQCFVVDTKYTTDSSARCCGVAVRSQALIGTEENMELTEPKKRRVRKRSIALRLEQALTDAEAAMQADVSVQRLCTTRIQTLNKMLARERHSKLKALEQELAEARQEIERLKQELQTARTTPATPASEPSAVEQALQKYEAERGEKTS